MGLNSIQQKLKTHGWYIKLSREVITYFFFKVSNFNDRFLTSSPNAFLCSFYVTSWQIQGIKGRGTISQMS